MTSSWLHGCLFQDKTWPDIGDGHPTFNRNPYSGYINPYYWVDYHPLLYGNSGSWSTLAHIIFWKYGYDPHEMKVWLWPKESWAKKRFFCFEMLNIEWYQMSKVMALATEQDCQEVDFFLVSWLLQWWKTDLHPWSLTCFTWKSAPKKGDSKLRNHHVHC